MTTIGLFFIRLYQLCIAPLIGDNCRFTPSCSYYAADALRKYGFMKGCYLAGKRILRCNPWCGSCGHDPVP